MRSGVNRNLSGAPVQYWPDVLAEVTNKSHGCQQQSNQGLLGETLYTEPRLQPQNKTCITAVYRHAQR